MYELALMALIFMVIFWLFIVRPARRREEQHAAMIANLHPGQRVMTSSGLLGVVREVAGREVALEISPGVVVRFVAQAIGRVEQPAAAETASEQVATEAGADSSDTPPVTEPSELSATPDDPSQQPT